MLLNAAPTSQRPCPGTTAVFWVSVAVLLFAQAILVGGLHFELVEANCVSLQQPCATKAPSQENCPFDQKAVSHTR
ncbi:hypothetical protein D3C76_1361200 [compost metagenome]